MCWSPGHAIHLSDLSDLKSPNNRHTSLPRVARTAWKSQPFCTRDGIKLDEAIKRVCVRPLDAHSPGPSS